MKSDDNNTENYNQNSDNNIVVDDRHYAQDIQGGIISDELISPQKAWNELLSMLKGKKDLLKRVMVIAEILVKEGMRPAKESSLELKTRKATMSRDHNLISKQSKSRG